MVRTISTMAMVALMLLTSWPRPCDVSVPSLRRMMGGRKPCEDCIVGRGGAGGREGERERGRRGDDEDVVYEAKKRREE